MSQSPTSQAKRRRLDNGSSALSRPFKSPLPKEAQRKEAPKLDAANIQPPETPAYPNKPAVLLNSPVSPLLNIKNSHLRQPHHPESDADVIALRRKRLTLQSRLTTLRSELETVQQALRIESGSRDDELRALKVKWRNISQKAAEELFETAKDKIERMGGMGAWKESERQRMRRMQMWEDDDFYAAAAGVVPSGDDAFGREQRDALDDVIDGEDGSCEQKEGDEGETFTMGMMLKSLNIEPDIIGFDVVEERWKSD